MVTCDKCGGVSCVKNGFMQRQQRYRCKACGDNFIDKPRRGQSERDRVLAVRPPASLVRPLQTPLHRRDPFSGYARPHHASLRHLPRQWKRRTFVIYDLLILSTPLCSYLALN